MVDLPRGYFDNGRVFVASVLHGDFFLGGCRGKACLHESAESGRESTRQGINTESSRREHEREKSEGERGRENEEGRKGGRERGRLCERECV